MTQGAEMLHYASAVVLAMYIKLCNILSSGTACSKVKKQVVKVI